MPSKSRNSAGLPQSSSNGSAHQHRSGGGRHEFSENAFVANSHFRMSEIVELPPSPPRKDYPAFQLKDHLSKQVQRQLERKASAKDVRRRPLTADRPPVETDKFEDFRAVKQNGLRRSGSKDKRSTDDTKSSAATPNRRQTLVTSFSGPRRREQSESRSSSTTSRHAERRRYLGRNNGSNTSRSSPSSKTEKSKPSTNDDFLEYEFAARSDSPTTKSSSSGIWQEEEPSDSATQSYARHNGFTNEIDAVDVNRLYPKKGSRGRKSRQEDDSDLATGPRLRSLSNRLKSNQDNGSHLSSTRHESNRNLTLEDEAEGVRRQGRQGSTGGNLKQDNAANSGSGTRENNQTSDVVKYRASSTSLNRNRSVRWLLKGVAAASYNGGWLPYDEMVPFPDEIANLNKFLDDCRNEVEAGTPGRFLTVVLGHQNSDLDSIVSTIAYAYFLSSIGGQGSKVFVPVLNMRQEDLVLHTEAVWLFKVTNLDTSKLLFVDQISLQYHHRFGNLKLVLVDHSRLAPHQETLQDAVIEIVDHNLMEDLYSWVPTKDIQQVGSCCTIIAERFAAETPERLAGRGINRLLLGPILLDTANLDPKAARCTARDMCMAAFLINGAGRYGQQGFFRLLRRMKFDVSTLSTMDMLRKDCKDWTLGPGKTDTYGLKGRVLSAAMSGLAVPLKEIMARKGILDDLRFFGRKLRLDLHVIVTGYYDNTDRYKREILIVPGNVELKGHVRACFRPHKADLQLSYIPIPGLPDDMVVYKQGLVTASRTILRQILKDYFEM